MEETSGSVDLYVWIDVVVKIVWQQVKLIGEKLRREWDAAETVKSVEPVVVER